LGFYSSDTSGTQTFGGVPARSYQGVVSNLRYARQGDQAEFRSCDLCVSRVESYGGIFWNVPATAASRDMEAN
jgi:hypothetical protein